MDMEQKKCRYLEKIKQLRLMDDTFFNTSALMEISPAWRSYSVPSWEMIVYA